MKGERIKMEPVRKKKLGEKVSCVRSVGDAEDSA